MAFFKLKALIRKAAASTYDQLWAAVGQVCDLFSDEELAGFGLHQNFQEHGGRTYSTDA
jgi:hypothetical protein